ncbi:MAG: AMP-binding protein, partial [Candidatus Limnocylindrales bacterium]
PWQPSAADLADSRLGRFVRAAAAGGTSGVGGTPDDDDLEALQARAAADPGWFWGAAADELELHWQRRPTAVLDLAGGPARARWWVGGAFNHAVAATEPWAAARPDDAALAWEGEDGDVRRFTWAELDREVRRAARRLAAVGVGEGTRVGILLPMLVETAVAVLALGRLRAIFTPIFSGYAAPAIAARLDAFEASHLITADGFLRRGAVIALKAVADEAVGAAPSVRAVVVVRRFGRAVLDVPMTAGRDVEWSSEPGAGTSEAGPLGAEAAARPADSVDDVPPTDPETPYMVIYTSGTTGQPKGTVHVHGGFPIKAAQDLAHTFDLRRGDALCWFTDLGWMMGPWAISGALLLGARLVMYEGAPDWPDPGRLWSLVARHRITHFGVSPTLIRALRVHGEAPVRDHDLSSLRVIGSTGEPWNPDPWRWCFEVVGGGRLPIVNYSGGTEIGGGIVGCSLLRPIRPTSFNGPCVGMAADIVDGAGRPVRGAVGELAIRAPWPGMTRGFWAEPDDERYREAYWARIPGLWVHGDWAATDADGYWYIHGRSDDTLKVAGKRVGPAEVEACAVAHPAVAAAAAIGVPDELKGEAIVVLCVPRPGVAWDETVAAEVTGLVVHDLGKPVRPKAVVAVLDLPRTRSGKVMRRVARAAWLGLDPGDITALENPAAVEAIALVARSS